MRLKNYTALDSDWLRRMIAAVKPPGVSGFDISFKNGAGNRGVAYAGGCSHHTNGRGGSSRSSVPYIIVSLRAATRFPYQATKHGAYLGVRSYTLQEVALEIAAHELRHLWQRKVPKGHRVWGSRGRYSERDADAYALRMLRRYRRGELGL